MKPRLQDAARVLGGRLIGADAAFTAVSTDTRSLDQGALFVALRGPNFDGADFIAAAAAAGAAGAILARPSAAALPQILVEDPLAALQALAKAWREDFKTPIVAVAGSNGKTSTKEMIGAILARRGPCLVTRGNLNNHIGVPLTLLRLETRHLGAVVEIGANRVGDVAALLPLVRPSVAVVTNAGAEHLEGFGDLDGVARGEGEAFAGLLADATAVINADDAYASYWRGLAGARRVLSFGLGETADFRAREEWLGIQDGEFVTRFTLDSPLGAAPILVHAGGRHNLMNALAAAAAAAAAGASLTEIAAGLADFRPVAGRLQLKAGVRDSFIIDDSYNANPSSVRAGLDVLGALAGEKWLVLGEMAELGASAQASHVEIGSYARARGVARLFGFGTLSGRAVEAFGAGAEWFADADELCRRLLAQIGPGVTVLVKGSRVNRLERVVAALTVAADTPAARAG
ncbi:MAG: UDP-N-acetylmuramoyl-tripeptide--D-alanyl-D-alanine ligase [Steroidobacteraceae bacterium]|nr:UDP-N-acetylmuramoyl-tripeptide--D-alanyl-D-alanine ligase [Steroidobacteraceae bacterium]